MVLCYVFFVSVSVKFHLMIVRNIFSSVKVAAWPPFGKELLTLLTMCSLCILTICNFSSFPFLVLRAGCDCSSSWSLLTSFFLNQSHMERQTDGNRERKKETDRQTDR